jgi:anti-sigma B factor antagonist
MGEAVMTTRRQADGAIVVDVRGTLDAATVDALGETCRPPCAGSGRSR